MDDMLYRVVKNRCQCRQCEDIIESRHRHDFVSCKCGAIFTDGGTAYIRRGAKDLGDPLRAACPSSAAIRSARTPPRSMGSSREPSREMPVIRTARP